MSKFKLPKRLKIGGAWWTVKQLDTHLVTKDEDEYLHGICRPSDKEILISKNEDTVDIFLHELIHAICSFMGYEKDDEQKVEAGAHALQMFIADNHEFIKRLANYLGGGR